MASPEPDTRVPRVFISYSWDDDAHKDWVKQLAKRLMGNGVSVTLDVWHCAPGEPIPLFMERGIRECEFVIVVCTPQLKERLDGRLGGVGYEANIMTAYAFASGDKRKLFIPVLRCGNWWDAAPTWLLGTVNIDLSNDPYSESQYEDLLRTLHNEREKPPPVGPRPNFEDKKRLRAGPPHPPVNPFVGSSTTQCQSSDRPLDALLERYREGGWIKLVPAVNRIVAGERDPKALCVGLGPEQSRLVEFILATLSDPSRLSDLLPPDHGPEVAS